MVYLKDMNLECRSCHHAWCAANIDLQVCHVTNVTNVTNVIGDTNDAML